jgi:RNA polymerase sigma-70 factor (ECF subfamily)
MILNIESPAGNERLQALRVAALVSRAQTGQKEAFGLLYEEYEGRVYRYVFARTSQVEQAEDLTQEVFVRAFDSIRSYRDCGKPFSNWLLRIAHNLVIDHYRWLAKHRSIELADLQPASDDDPVAEVEKNAEIKRILEAVPNLTPGQREVISLRFGAGLHLAEAAAVMKKSIGAVKMLQHQAVRRLKGMLETSL